MQLIKNLLESKYVLRAAILYSGLVTYFFLMPTSGLPKVGISGFDKVAHVLLFFLLTFLWLLFFELRNKKMRWFFVLGFTLVLLVYGILIEVVQELFTPSRTADAYDVFADMIGVGCGIAFFKTIKSKLLIGK